MPTYRKETEVAVGRYEQSYEGEWIGAEPRDLYLSEILPPEAREEMVKDGFGHRTAKRKGRFRIVVEFTPDES